MGAGPQPQLPNQAPSWLLGSSFPGRIHMARSRTGPTSPHPAQHPSSPTPHMPCAIPLRDLTASFLPGQSPAQRTEEGASGGSWSPHRHWAWHGWHELSAEVALSPPQGPRDLVGGTFLGAVQGRGLASIFTWDQEGSSSEPTPGTLGAPLPPPGSCPHSHWPGRGLGPCSTELGAGHSQASLAPCHSSSGG